MCERAEACEANGGCFLDREARSDAFELHVTVAEADLDEFREVCARLGAKPLLLALQLALGGTQRDLMTSHTMRGNLDDALAEVRRQADAFGAAGFDVVRTKIETVPWHPLAPTVEGIDENLYFESHVAVRIPGELRARVDAIARNWSAHPSRNAFKRDADVSTYMLTIRSHRSTHASHMLPVNGLLADLRTADIDVGKVRTEYAVHDSRPTHDAAWLGAA